MPLVVKDRVKETTLTTGTGTVTLGGAVSNFQSFTAIGDGNTTYYTITLDSAGEWEVGIGTYTASGTTLSRDSVLESSNGGSLVNFSAGTKSVFCTYPAETSVSDGKTNVIEVNSTDAALRITQLGTGNALLVEDSANPDSTPFVIDTNGNVGIGTTTPTAPLQLAYTAGVPDASLLTTDAAIITAEDAAPGFSFVVAANTSSQRGVFKATRARGTLAAPTVPNSEDDTFSLLGAIYDGVLTRATAAINMAVDGVVSSGVAPQRITFLTGETTSRLERMRITGAGDVGIGTTSPGAKLDVVANSTSDALRITQTGSGNALVVEDSANPDSTPFVIDAGGKVINGYTSTFSGLPAVSAEYTQLGSIGFVQNGRYIATSAGPAYNTMKSRSATIGSWSPVSSGDALGAYRFWGDDGASFVESARVEAFVDGTPGTNDMPGRLVFSTTADGASSPTERMRIDSAGRVTLNTTASTINTLLVATGTAGATGASIRPVLVQTSIQSSATTDVLNVRSFAVTAAASFTLPNLTHFSAGQGTIGAGSTVTNQYGFAADSTLIGATNNYGFYSNIASGTGRWNFYANGTADNYFAGNVGIGRTPINSTYSLSTVAGKLTSIGMPTDSWTFAGLNVEGITGGAGILYSHGSFRASWSCNGYRNSSNTWTSLALNAQTGAAMIEQDPAGLILFRTDATKATGSGLTVTERMRIDSSGNVGIGISGVNYRLAVQTTANSQGAAFIQNSGLNAWGLEIGTHTAASESDLVFTSNAVVGSQDSLSFVAEGTGFFRWMTGGTSHKTGTAGATEAMRINASNNVGIGTTSPACALDVVGGIQTSRTGVTSPAATDGNVFSGTYTPTLTNTTNIASSTAAVCQYMRVGNVVTVSGTVTIDPTATGRIVMGMTLPIASNFAGANECGGTFASSGTTTVNVGSVAADSTNDRATFDGVTADAASRVYAFSFTYRII